MVTQHINSTMAKFLLVCLILLVDVLAVLAMSSSNHVDKVKTTTSLPSPPPKPISATTTPTRTRTLDINAAKAMPPPRRSASKHHHHHSTNTNKPVSPSVAPASSPAITRGHHHDQLKGSKTSIIPPQHGGENQPKPLSSLDSPHDAVLAPPNAEHNAEATKVAAPTTEGHGNEANDNEQHHQAATAGTPDINAQAAPPSMDGRRLGKHHGHHHSHDKSVAGGGVILGGLATTFLVSIFCYIRATRRKNNRRNGEVEEILN